MTGVAAMDTDTGEEASASRYPSRVSPPLPSLRVSTSCPSLTMLHHSCLLLIVKYSFHTCLEKELQLQGKSLGSSEDKAPVNDS